MNHKINLMNQLILIKIQNNNNKMICLQKKILMNRLFNKIDKKNFKILVKELINIMIIWKNNIKKLNKV